MDITIYQINMGRDHNRIAFEGLDLLKIQRRSMWRRSSKDSVSMSTTLS